MAEDRRSAKQIFLAETKDLAERIKKTPQASQQIVRRLSATRDMANLLHLKNTSRLCAALETLYETVGAKKIDWNENLTQLIFSTVDKIVQLIVLSDDISQEELLPYIVYCDKAAAGEIFDARTLTAQAVGEVQAEPVPPSPPAEDFLGKSVPLPLSEVNRVLNGYEELIARTYKITGALEAQPKSATINQIISDVQFLQSGIQHAHEQLLHIVKDNDFFVRNHRDFHGFFVFANGKKYFIPSDHIVDVTYENVLEYIVDQTQRYMRRTVTDSEGEEKEERLPIYTLSSLFPGQRAMPQSSVDTIVVAEFMNQRIGIIVEAVQNFASLVKKPLPPSFKAFRLLEGIVFDETYDMVPILHIPEVMKLFRSQRRYDLKKFEANTKPRVFKILVVDDSETTRQIEQTILAGNGFSVEQAKDGITALELVRTKQFDLIVTDDDMPRMNGEILVDNLRRMENYATVPVVVMAATPIEAADAFISKADFRRGDLIQTVEELLHV